MWGKIARWLLPISLAVNLFFAVVAIRHSPFMRPQPPEPRDVVRFLKSKLSPEDAAIMQQSFAAHGSGQLTDGERGNGNFQERISAALNADPFDPQALRDIFADARAKHQAMEENMETAFVEAASKISPEGRAKLAAQRGHGGFMRRRMERRGGPGGPPPDGPPPPQR